MRQSISLTLLLALSTTLTGTAAAAAQAKNAVPAAPAASAAAVDPHAAHMGAMPAAKPTAKKPTAPDRLVDINSASKAELKKLPGIGDAEAEKIIKNRPYLSKTELVGKGVLGEGPYLSLRHKVIAFQKGRTTGPKPTAGTVPAARAASAPKQP